MKEKAKCIVIYIAELAITIFCISDCIYNWSKGIEVGYRGNSPLEFVSYFGLIILLTYIFIKDIKGEDV